MSDDIKELVKRLREAHARVSLWPENRGEDGFMDLLALRNEVPNAIDALEALVGEVERLTRSEEGLLKTLGLERREKHAAQTERDRLKAVNQKYRAVLTFYGDKRNWLSPTKDSFALQYDPEPPPVQKVGASLAAKVLEETP